MARLYDSAYPALREAMVAASKALTALEREHRLAGMQETPGTHMSRVEASRQHAYEHDGPAV